MWSTGHPGHATIAHVSLNHAVATSKEQDTPGLFERKRFTPLIETSTDGPIVETNSEILSVTRFLHAVVGAIRFVGAFVAFIVAAITICVEDDRGGTGIVAIWSKRDADDAILLPWVHCEAMVFQNSKGDSVRRGHHCSGQSRRKKVIRSDAFW